MADRVHFSWKGKSGSFSNFSKIVQPRSWKGSKNRCPRLLWQFWPLDSSEDGPDTAQQGWVLTSCKSGRNSHFWHFYPRWCGQPKYNDATKFITELKGLLDAVHSHLWNQFMIAMPTELSFKHECGFYASSVGRTVTFLGVKDPLNVPKPVIGLQEASLLEHLPCCASGQLHLLFSVEKDGSSTKLVLQVLICRSGAQHQLLYFWPFFIVANPPTRRTLKKYSNN